MSWIVILIMILLGVFDSPWEHVQTGDIDGAIVSGADGSMFIESEAYWTPEPSDVRDAEDAIADVEGMLNHSRQYVGFYEDDARKIFVNGFCQDIGIDWLSEPVLVEDGGESFFTAIYNADTAELERFDYNGEA